MLLIENDTAAFCAKKPQQLLISSMDGIESRLPEYYDTYLFSEQQRVVKPPNSVPSIRRRAERQTAWALAVLRDRRPPSSASRIMVSCITRARRPALFLPLLAALAAVALAQQRVCPISDL